jgi:hypothetical protein
MFQADSQKLLEKAREVVERFRGLVDENKEREVADPYVVALGILENEGQMGLLVRMECAVVSSERWNPGGKAHIPDACLHYGILHMDFAGVFYREGWKP